MNLPSVKTATDWTTISILAAIYVELHGIGGNRFCDLAVIFVTAYWMLVCLFTYWRDDKFLGD